MSLVEEYYYTEFNRVLIVKVDDGYVYSVDVYKKLEGEPEGCSWRLDVGEARLCYLPLEKGCTAVILETSAGIEIVNLRMKTVTRFEPQRIAEECIGIAKARGLL